ncbi:hypothetical protein ACFX2C_009066 [Malus domestica]
MWRVRLRRGFRASSAGSVKSVVQKTSASLRSSSSVRDEGREKEKRLSSRSDNSDRWLHKLVESMVGIFEGIKRGGNEEIYGF